MLSNIGTVILWVISLIGLLGDWDDALSQISDIFGTLQPFIAYLEAVGPYIAYSALVLLYMINRTKIVTFIKSYVLAPIYLATQIHNFQHLYDGFIDEIDMKRQAGGTITLDDSFCRQNIYQLLSQIRRTLAVIGEYQTSVHIKIPVNLDGEQSGLLEFEHAMLKTYERAPSPKEDVLTSIADGDSKPKLVARSNKERFIIAYDGTPEWIDGNKSRCTQKKLRCNSAYNHVLGSGQHSWISNNLIGAHKKGTYISTSTNWRTYYKSMAVVAMAPHQLQEKGEIEDYFGILIADSRKKGAFNKRLVRKVLGYYAHRMYRVLKYIG